YLREVLQPQMVVLRGIAEMAVGRPRVFELAGAEQAGIKKANLFPRGTAERKINPGGRPYPPGQRVRWVAGVLPFLGYEDVAREINPDLSWRPVWDAPTQRYLDINAQMGGVLIPAFLDPTSPPSTWWVQMPSVLDRRYASTHFVGIAGVGLDA